MFAEFPQNRAGHPAARYALGDYVVLHEEVRCAPKQDPSRWSPSIPSAATRSRAWSSCDDGGAHD